MKEEIKCFLNKCKIVFDDIEFLNNMKIPREILLSKKVYEDEFVYAFEDIERASPTHILIVPKKYFEKGDPYQCYCQKTSRLITEKFNRIPPYFTYIVHDIVFNYTFILILSYSFSCIFF